MRESTLVALAASTLPVLGIVPDPAGKVPMPWSMLTVETLDDVYCKLKFWEGSWLPDTVLVKVTVGFNKEDPEDETDIGAVIGSITSILYIEYLKVTVAVT